MLVADLCYNIKATSFQLVMDPEVFLRPVLRSKYQSGVSGLHGQH